MCLNGFACRPNVVATNVQSHTWNLHINKGRRIDVFQRIMHNTSFFLLILPSDC